MARLTKTKIDALLFIISAILGLLVIFANLADISEDNCLQEVDDLYVEQVNQLQESAISSSDRNWYHILEVKKLIEKNMVLKEVYRDNAHTERDKAINFYYNSTKTAKQIILKKNECRSYSRKTQRWFNWIIFIAIIQISLASTYVVRTKWKL